MSSDRARIEAGAGGPQAVELAVGCEGQLGEGEPPSWHFVGRKVVTDFGCDTTEAFRLRHVGCCRLIPDDPGHRNLPEAFVGKGDNHSFADQRGRAQNVFYFGGKDVEPADDHHLLQPAGHIENAVPVNVPQVACVVPAVSVERQPRLVAVGLQRVLVGLAQDLAVHAQGNVPSGEIHDAPSAFGRDPSDGTRSAPPGHDVLVPLERGDASLGRPVGLEYGHAVAFLKRVPGVEGKRRRARVDIVEGPKVDIGVCEC